MAQLLVACLITGLGIVLLWSNSPTDDAHIEHFGSSLAAALATQTTEPFAAEDLMHLGILANRIIELPEVIGATIYTLDGRMLAMSGDIQRGRPFVREIVQDEAVVGYVRLHIDASTFGSSAPIRSIVASLIIIVLVPLLFTIAPQLPALLSRATPRRALSTPVLATRTRAGDPEDIETNPCYLLTLNLFNQLNLAPEQCARELDFARGIAHNVTHAYHGTVESLPGTGLLLTFDDHGSERAFEVICAGFVLAQLLRDAESWGKYRIGAHVVWLSAGETLQSAADELADAAVLSALAKENCVAVSAALFSVLDRKDRFHSTALANPLLEELESIGAAAHLVHSLTPAHQALVSKQVATLAYSEASTARESTF